MTELERVRIDRRGYSLFDMEESAEDIRAYRTDDHKVGECIVGRQKWSKADWKVAVLRDW